MKEAILLKLQEMEAKAKSLKDTIELLTLDVLKAQMDVVSMEEGEYTESSLRSAMEAAYKQGVKDANAQIEGQEIDHEIDESTGGYGNSLYISGTVSLTIEDQVYYLNEAPKIGKIDEVFEEWFKQFEPRLKEDESDTGVDKVDNV